VVDPAHDAERIAEALLEELVRSASNKGCTVVEAVQPDDPATLASWERLGLPRRPAHPTIVTAAGVAARHPMNTGRAAPRAGRANPDPEESS
jgi:hypothetical protein